MQIERELILSNDNKNASKVPLSSGLHQFIPKMAGTVAPDHPVKQIQAWNHQMNSTQIEQIHSQMPLGRPTQMPEDVTALADRDYGKDSKEKNAVSKTYHTIKDIISSKFKKDQVTTGSLDELNNATSHAQQQQQQQVVHHSNSPYTVKKPRPLEMTAQTTSTTSTPNTIMHSNGPQRPQTDSPIYHHHQQHMQQQQYLNMQQSQYQRAASQPQLYDNRSLHSQQQQQQFHIPTPAERRGSVDNVEVTDSDDGGFISKARQRANEYLAQNGHYYDQQQQQQQRNQQPHIYRPQSSTLEHINERSNGDDGYSGRQSRSNLDGGKKSTTPVNSNSDYEKGENMGNSSNVDSGRESLAYSSGTRPQTQMTNNVDQNGGGDDSSEWVSSNIRRTFQTG